MSLIQQNPLCYNRGPFTREAFRFIFYFSSERAVPARLAAGTQEER
jgi:hypothetical protein